MCGKNITHIPFNLGGCRLYYCKTVSGIINGMEEKPQEENKMAVVSMKQLLEAGVPAGLVRISCGLEDKEDLIADLAQALQAI